MCIRESVGVWFWKRAEGSVFELFQSLAKDTVSLVSQNPKTTQNQSLKNDQASQGLRETRYLCRLLTVRRSGSETCMKKGLCGSGARMSTAR